MYDKSTCAVHFRDETIQICCADYEEMDDKCIGEYNMCVGEYNICVGWLVFNVQRAIFQLYSGREHLNI
jgi:hypothetical protein